MKKAFIILLGLVSGGLIGIGTGYAVQLVATEVTTVIAPVKCKPQSPDCNCKPVCDCKTCNCGK